jgi:MFS family permease
MSEGQKADYDFSKRQITLGLVAIFAVYGTMAYFVQTLTIARPKIAANLGGMSLYAWAVTIPSLISAFVTLVFGKLSDIYGRRIMLLISVICCLTGTILGALSPNFIFLIVASVISALGIGAMMPLVFAVVGDLFPPEKRGKWIGLLNIPTGIFSLIGPTIGGWLALSLLDLAATSCGVPDYSSDRSSFPYQFRNKAQD